jgi:hypothetical protein
MGVIFPGSHRSGTNGSKYYLQKMNNQSALVAEGLHGVYIYSSLPNLLAIYYYRNLHTSQVLGETVRREPLSDFAYRLYFFNICPCDMCLAFLRCKRFTAFFLQSSNSSAFLCQVRESSLFLL